MHSCIPVFIVGCMRVFAIRSWGWLVDHRQRQFTTTKCENHITTSLRSRSPRKQKQKQNPQKLSIPFMSPPVNFISKLSVSTQTHFLTSHPIPPPQSNPALVPKWVSIGIRVRRTGGFYFLYGPFCVVLSVCFSVSLFVCIDQSEGSFPFLFGRLGVMSVLWSAAVWGVDVRMRDDVWM